MKPNTDRRSSQSGQVLAIVALMMTVMVGALGLALDGGRIYVDRRVIQTASDVAALGAADAYGSAFRGTAAPACPASSSSAAVAGAASAAVTEFAYQVHRPTSSFSASGADPSITYTDTAGGYSFTLTRSVPLDSVDPAACAFKVSAHHTLQMFFIQVLNQISTQDVTTTAQAISAQNLVVPGAALFLLDPSNVTAPGQKFCGSGSPNDTLAPGGTGSLTIDGSMVTDGNMQMWTSNSYSMTMNSGGGIFDHCDGSLTGKPTTNITWNPTPPGTTKFHGHTNYINDPFGVNGIDWCGTDSNCASTGNAGTSTTWLPNMDKAPYTTTSPTCCNPATHSELEPGQYTSDPGFANVGGSAGCWFVEPGIYTWQQGLRTTNGTGIVSNELTPPGAETAPSTGNGQVFNWEGGGNGSGTSPGSAGCEGSVVGQPTVCVSSCAGRAATTYSFRVASVRAEAAPPGGSTACSQQPQLPGAGGTSVATCWQQSYLSTSCVTLTNTVAPLTTFQIGISNVPGMGNATQLQSGDAHDRLLDSRYDIFASTGGCNDTATWGYVTSAFFNCTAGGTVIEPNATVAPANCSGMNTGTQTPVCDTASTILFTSPANHYESDAAKKPCGLGYVVSTTINSTDLPATFAPSGTACTIGTAPAPGSGCAPWYTASTLCSGQTSCDAANEDYCLSHTGSGYCQILFPNSGGGDVTPGGALWITPPSAGPPPNGTQCFMMTNGGTQYFVYGTAELYDIAYFAVNNCPDTMEGGNGGAFVGWGYLPGSTDLLTLGGNGSPFEGGIDLWALVINGGANIVLTGDVPAFPITFPLSSRLLTCTNTTPGCPPP